ncbi:MAG: acyl carrier protein [Saprospiraceae bacterium]|nr:acyl carrier protein [Saprospiraceae bacterium]
MDKAQIIARINTFLSEEFEVEPSVITPEASIKDTLGLDSLDFVDLVVLIERHFGFKMAGEDFADIKTFEDFYNYVYARLQQGVGA